MTRWHWSFDEPHEPQRPVDEPLQTGDDPDVTGGRRLRATDRGRVVAGLVVLLVIALPVAFLQAGGGGHHRARAAAAHRQRPTPALLAAARAQALAAGEQEAVQAVLARMPAVRAGGPGVREVALTFDDGPGPYTARIVRELYALHTPATFFVVGSMERWFSDATAEALRDGDAIGDHTQSHPALASLSPRDQRLQLLDQAAAISIAGAPFPHLFRPPYGSFDAATLRELQRLHMLMVLWSTDTGDYTRPGTQVIAQRALLGAHPGAIILLHDAGGDRSQTLAALPAIVRGLRRMNLVPVTVPQLMRDDPPAVAPPLTAPLGGA